MLEAYCKVKKVIQSCNKKEHIKAAKKMLFLFKKKFFDSKSHNIIYYTELENLYYNKINEFV